MGQCQTREFLAYLPLPYVPGVVVKSGEEVPDCESGTVSVDLTAKGSCAVGLTSAEDSAEGARIINGNPRL
jgi:hypothetical protein